MENWQLALVVISALLVGTLIPAITQYRATMKTWDRLMKANEADLRRSVVEIAQLSQRLNQFSGALESNSKHMHSFFEAFENITEGVRKLSGTVRTASVVGAAVAPAVTAAVRALQNAQVATSQSGAAVGYEPGDLVAHDVDRNERELRVNGTI
jgi:uncharacterized protein YoxC